MRCGQTKTFALPVASHKAKRGFCLVKVNLPFKQTALQTAGTALTSEPPTVGASQRTRPSQYLQLLQRTPHCCCIAGAEKTAEKCKQRGGLDGPLTHWANYSCLWSTIGCLEEGKWVWSETSLRSNNIKCYLPFPFIPSTKSCLEFWSVKPIITFLVDTWLIYQPV